ncbi:MAG TPA: 1-acyl-sn-glycerol-3-phosphate acyltransferase [Bacteroidales bacterium]
MILRKLAQIALKLLGWKCEALTPDFDKCVLLVAPHTSNWDFLMGKLGYAAIGRNANFVIKNEWMKGPLGFIFKILGGIGVDRSKASRFTDVIAEIYQTRDKFSLAITPEGTRKINPKWKKGFYHIALKAQVPIVLVVLDYKKKYMALFDVFYPTGDEHADIKAIQQKYKGATGKYPEQFSIGE